MKLQKDLREFIELLNSHDVDYLVAGAFSLAFHGLARATGDIDLFIRRSQANADKLWAVLNDFGFGEVGLDRDAFLEPQTVIQLGVAPHRIDLLTDIDAVSFDEAWLAREIAVLDDLPVPMLSKKLLIANKLAVGRPQDIADVARLREQADRSPAKEIL
jgi:hypothetical protein